MFLFEREMRLGQLARKLEVNPGRLMEVLKELSIDTDRGLNTPLDDQKVTRIKEKLREEPEPMEVKELVEELPVEASPEVSENEGSEEIVMVEDPEGEKEEELEKNEIPEELKPEVELIKAPKVQLPGLKVVGKINLPEPPKKEENEKKSEGSQEENRRPVNRERKPWNKENRNRGKLSPSYEDKIRFLTINV